MEQINVSKRVTANRPVDACTARTILSMSLLTVMAGAAIAPALGIIKAHFSEASGLLVQLIVSMPALLIIVTNLFFLAISRRLRTRAIATTGLLLYVAAGAGCFFVDDIHVLLVMRALLGISVGLIMPLLSAALYLGQFLSPLIVMPLSHVLFGTDLTAPYKVGILLCLVFLVQIWTTRHFQSLPPATPNTNG